MRSHTDRTEDSDPYRRASFLTEKEAIVRQLAYHERGIINPRHSKLIPVWDALTFVCLLFTAVVTPWEVCLLQNPSDRWAVANWIVNTFLMD